MGAAVDDMVPSSKSLMMLGDCSTKTWLGESCWDFPFTLAALTRLGTLLFLERRGEPPAGGEEESGRGAAAAGQRAPGAGAAGSSWA